jgi:lipoate-protein ligase A
MEVDRALLNALIDGKGLDTVRVYRWPPGFVTYGRLQQKDEVSRAFPDAHLLQRPTGGLAVEHGNDITVSVVAHEARIKALSMSDRILASYQVILSGVLDTLDEYGIRTATGVNRHREDHADCFASIGRCDVLDLETNSKVVGSAQLRARGAILQQMSIRLHPRYHIDEPEFVLALKRRFAKRLLVDQWKISSEYTSSPTVQTATA